MERTRQLCTFFLDDLFVGVDVMEVQEVLRYQAMTPVPLAPDFVSGLINLRGQVVTAIELRRMLELDDRPEEKQPMNVVLRTDEGAVSLLVDSIGDVIEVDERSYESLPRTITGVLGEHMSGLYKLDRELLLVLDPQRILRRASSAA